MRIESIRLRAGALTRSRIALPALVAGWLSICVALPMSGCGGGSDDGSRPNPSPSPSPSASPLPIKKAVSLSVTWGARTRGLIDAGALSSARSVWIRFYEGGERTDTPTASIRIDRDMSRSDAYTASYNTGSDVIDVTKPCLVEATFYAQPGEAGSPVGAGSMRSSIDQNTGELNNGIAVTGLIKTVTVLTNKVFAAETSELSVSAVNEFGTMIPITPSAVRVDITNGTDKLALATPASVDDPIKVRGLAPGTATVLAVVDGVSSAAVNVVVDTHGVVNITPPDPIISLERSIKLTGTVTGLPAGVNTGVTWSVITPNGGSITADGTYTAPKTEGVYTVQATSIYDPTKTATTNITVASGVAVSITPSKSNISWENVINFKATVSLTDDQSVTWAVEGNGNGTITPDGVYTAPKKDGTFFVTATSNYDPRKSARAEVTVISRTAVKVTPAASDISWQETVQLNATVTDAPANSGVTWTVEGGADNGTISATGLYTAPKKTGTYTIVATSKYDPRKSGTATVTVTSKVGVEIKPDTNVKVPAGEQKTFTATVTRAVGDNSVKWEVVPDPNGPPVGTITQDGVYTAPAKRRVDIIKATSNYDPGSSDTVQIQVVAGGAEVIIN